MRCKLKTWSAFASAIILGLSAQAETLSLNIGWQFAKAPDDALFPLASALGATNRVEWQRVSVPHSINALDSFDGHAGSWGEEKMWRGFAFYKKDIQLDDIAGKKFFLEFETVRQTVYLYVNGTLAGYYEAGIAPCAFDITPYVRQGANAIFVATDNAAAQRAAGDNGEFCTLETKPGTEPGSGTGVPFQWNLTDFNPLQGGLTGNVRLHVKPLTYLTLPVYNNLKTTGTYITAKDFDFEKGEATICVNAEVRNESGKEVKAKVKVEIRDIGQSTSEIRLTTDDRRLSSITPASDANAVYITALENDVYEKAPQPTRVNGPETATIVAEGRASGLTFWSPDTPHLYDVVVTLLDEDGKVIDSETIRTGFREVKYDYAKGGLFVNGKLTRLPGYAHRSTGHWPCIGVPPDWLWEKEMEWVRESNASHIRWMHVAPKPAGVRACDRAGVVQTCPSGDKEYETKGRQWNQRVEAMRDVMIYFRNSPSIFFWEAGNNAVSASHMREMRLLKESIDPDGGRFMGCRTIKDADQVAEAEYVGTMLNRSDVEAFASMRSLGRYIPITETEYIREESPRRVWDLYSPPDFDYRTLWLGRGNRQNGFDAHNLTQEEFARKNAQGYAYFWGTTNTPYTAWAALCWSDMNEMGRNSFAENSRVSGRVDAARIPKESFWVFKTIQSEEPSIKVLGHWNYPKDEGDNYVYNLRRDTGHHWEFTEEKAKRKAHAKTVYVIASAHAAAVEFFVNGESKGRKTEPVEPPFTWAFEGVDVADSQGFVEAVAYDAALREIARDKVVHVGEPAKLVLEPLTGPEGLRADGADVAVIDVKLVDAEGRVCPLAFDKVEFEMSFQPSTIQPFLSTFQPSFLGGFNSGTFKNDPERPSPIGENWVKLECGRARVFLRAGFEPGEIRIAAKMAGRDVLVAPTTATITSVPASPFAPQQQMAPNTRDWTVKSDAPVVQKAKIDSGRVPTYNVFVDGKRIDFGKNVRAPFKPDDNTGVVAAISPVLAALKDAGVEVEYSEETGKKLRMPAHLSSFKAPYLKMSAGGKTIEAARGDTVIWVNGGEDRNLTNFEMAATSGGKVLVGELAPFLEYIPDVKMTIDNSRFRVDIDTKKGQ